MVELKSLAAGDVDLPGIEQDREGDVVRLTVTVNSTLRVIDAVLAGKIDPVPTQAPFAMCASCPWRTICAACYLEPRRVLVAT